MFTLLYVPARFRRPVRLLECPDRASLLRPGGLRRAAVIRPQGPAPVTGVFPAGDFLPLLETGIQAIQLSPCHAGPPEHRPQRLDPASG